MKTTIVGFCPICGPAYLWGHGLVFHEDYVHYREGQGTKMIASCVHRSWGRKVQAIQGTICIAIPDFGAPEEKTQPDPRWLDGVVFNDETPLRRTYGTARTH